MKKASFQTSDLHNRTASWPMLARMVCVLILGFAALGIFHGAAAQTEDKLLALPPTQFRVGERLSYNVSFERFNNVGYAEIYVVSRGKLNGRDSVELRSKFKTSELVSAAFYLVDESRTTFASAETGLPLYVQKTANSGVLPQESISNFLAAPTTSYDLLTLIYQIRNSGGSGTFQMQENESLYTVTSQVIGNERVRVDTGEYQTVLASVQSDFFAQKGIRDLRVNFSVDEQRVPVQIRFKTIKGEFRATLASAQVIEPEASATPTPVPAPTPLPVFTPRPTPTPAPYVDNQPLSPDLPFVLGETLEYRISTAGRSVGTVLLQAKERRLAAGHDSLLLSATVAGAEQDAGIFVPGDAIRAQVNPETLTPHQFEIKFTGTLSNLNQTTQFDQRTGRAVSNGTEQIQVPVGTHNILSLIYAVRSFNLKPSKDAKNPVNDTRVAVYWDKQPYVFTLRPAEAEFINLRGEKVPAQLITVSTGNPQLDALNLRLWLSNERKRVPLRISVGSFQADLVAESIVKPG